MTPERLDQIRAADDESVADPGCPGARHRRELLAEVQRLRDELRKADAVVQKFAYESDERMRYLKEALAERNQARSIAATAVNHLDGHVAHQDDPCDFDHHGFCQTHFISGSEDGKCGTAEARQFLDSALPGWLTDNTKDQA